MAEYEKFYHSRLKRNEWIPQEEVNQRHQIITLQTEMDILRNILKDLAKQIEKLFHLFGLSTSYTVTNYRYQISLMELYNEHPIQNFEEVRPTC
jgi:hypothetical protein